jgi:hypothetical protein
MGVQNAAWGWTLLGAGAWVVLCSYLSWSQLPEPSVEPRQVQVGIEVGFFVDGPPELTLHAGVQRGGWRAEIRATRDLSQSPSLRIGFAQSVEQPGWRVVGEANWEPSQTSLRLGLEAQGTLAAIGAHTQMNVSVEAAFPGGLAWEFQGSLQAEGLRVRVEPLRWQADQFAWESVDLAWSPDAAMTVRATLDSSTLYPLQLGLQRRLEEELEVQWTSRFALREHALWDWQWREMQVAATRGSWSTGLVATLHGWQEAWIEGSHSFLAGSKGRGRLRIGPSGWLGTELGGTWRDPSSGSLQAGLKFAPRGWAAATDFSWFDPSFSLQGKVGLTPGGLEDLMLVGRAAGDAMALSGLLKYARGFSLLNLSGDISQEEWQWGGAASWTSQTGWENTSVSLGRGWSF